MSCCTSFFSKTIVRLRAVDAAHCAHVTCATLPVPLPPHLSPATASMAGGPPRYRMHPPDLEVLPSFDEVSPSFEKGWPLSNHPALLQKSVLLHDALQPVHAAMHLKGNQGPFHSLARKPEVLQLLQRPPGTSFWPLEVNITPLDDHGKQDVQYVLQQSPMSQAPRF